MFSKIVALSAILALTSAGVLQEVHYPESHAISSQSVVHHGPPAAKLVAATPVYHAALHADIPAPIHFRPAAAPPAPKILAPVHYSSAGAVSSQSIIRHDQPHDTKVIATAPVATKLVAPVHSVHYSPLQYPVTKVIAPTPIHYPVTKYISQTPVVTKVIAPASKVLLNGHHEHHIEEYAHPKYEFSYSVADGHSGDHKSQHEVRDGDVVHGEYSLLEADGSVRHVQYSADDHSGFNAVVSHSAPGHHDHEHAPVVVAAH